jgi:hypothetical protein
MLKMQSIAGKHHWKFTILNLALGLAAILPVYWRIFSLSMIVGVMLRVFTRLRLMLLRTLIDVLYSNSAKSWNSKQIMISTAVPPTPTPKSAT